MGVVPFPRLALKQLVGALAGLLSLLRMSLVMEAGCSSSSELAQEESCLFFPI